jgi:AraC family transcriptional activator of pobA
MEIISLDEFYKDTSMLIPEGINKEIGHFNVFKIADLHKNNSRSKPVAMPYNRRAYYKISMIIGRNRAEYADKVIDIDKNALLFATPKIPYNYEPQGGEQDGYFCISHLNSCCKAKAG